MKCTKLKQSKTLTSNHITTQITTVLLNNFVKYTCKIIYMAMTKGNDMKWENTSIFFP